MAMLIHRCALERRLCLEGLSYEDCFAWDYLSQAHEWCVCLLEHFNTKYLCRKSLFSTIHSLSRHTPHWYSSKCIGNHWRASAKQFTWRKNVSYAVIEIHIWGFSSTMVIGDHSAYSPGKQMSNVTQRINYPLDFHLQRKDKTIFQLRVTQFC